MTKYLYGAAVQGIQGFIFQTNKLREIVGASELVEDICTSLFAEALREAKGVFSPEDLESDPNAILNAAGNIKYIFTDEEACCKLVRSFPMKVMEFAPGITVSQSVVEFDGDFAKAVGKLELNLRMQRNKPMPDLNVGLMGVMRSRETGLPVIKTPLQKEILMDAGTFCKLHTNNGGERKNTTQRLCEKVFGNNITSSQLAFDTKDLTDDNDWIAVIHADGNGLGQVVRKIGSNTEDLKDFSLKLNEATVSAAEKAYSDIGSPMADGKYSLRPIVIGGDDLTVICRGDIAVMFTQAFLRHFETETHKRLSDILSKLNAFADGSEFLTACAGIAFVKSSYPFHFAYRLAESLCDRAKKNTKKHFNADKGNLPASCLMFHKVQDSFVSDYESIVERELRPQPDISFEFGPFYLYE
ncbi:MAG: hypothetical protein K2K95_05480, partial [Muribaculaceae bacterium]|nr:hypothetical protein [Muribaculaceae bacterium]